jgi:hypothetical protein
MIFVIGLAEIYFSDFYWSVKAGHKEKWFSLFGVCFRAALLRRCQKAAFHKLNIRG